MTRLSSILILLAAIVLVTKCEGQQWGVVFPGQYQGFSLQQIEVDWQSDFYGETFTNACAAAGMDMASTFDAGSLPAAMNRVTYQGTYGNGRTTALMVIQTNIIGRGFEFSSTHGTVNFLSCTNLAGGTWTTNSWQSPLISPYTLTQDFFRLAPDVQANWFQCSLFDTNCYSNGVVCACSTNDVASSVNINPR